jgi:DivIVA domain-containing protein
MERHETHRGGDTGWGSAPRLTPDDIQRKEFRSARLRVGYVMEEVDEFLDQVTDTLTALLAENERLRAQAADRPAEPTPDPAAAAPAPSDAADRAAVEAFIQREKAFLQSLGALVQEHAKALKGMVRSARSAAHAETSPASAPVADTAREPEVPTATAAGEPDVAAASVDQGTAEATEADRDRMPGAPAEAPPAADEGEAAGWAPGPETAAPAASAGPEGEGSGEERDASATDADTGEVTAVTEEPIRVDEPEPARSRRDERSADGSLRELFWGEE